MTNPTSTEQEPATSALAGFNVLLMGPAGTGKTHSLGTLVDADPKLEVFYLGMEPGLESLLGYWTDRGKPIPENLHWHTQERGRVSFKELAANAKLVNTMSYEALTKMPDPERSKHDQYIKLMETLFDFPCDRTGKKFGSVDSWGTNRVLAVDGMTGLGIASMSNVIGGKAVKSQPEWGVAQDQLEKLLRMICDGCRCHFVLLAHVEREQDQILGGVKITVSTLGKALAPKIPQMFSDVIYCKRTGDKWVWDTNDPAVDIKTRNLPFASNQAPDFGPILKKWKSRGGVV